MTPTPDDIATGSIPAADVQAAQEAKSFASAANTGGNATPSIATVPSRREELNSDLIEQQKHLRLLIAAATMIVICTTFILFICTVVEVNSHLKDINQFALWFLSILALPPTLLLVVLVKGVFAGKEDKPEGKADSLPSPLVVKLIQEIIKPH